MPRSSLRKPLTKFTSAFTPVFGLACLLGSVGLQNALAQPAPQPSPPAPTIAPSPAPKPTSIDQQLLGQWRTRQPIGGDTLTLVFAPKGKAFLILSPATATRTVGREIGYTIDATPKPSHIDFNLGDLGTVQTLFELNGKEMRLQLLETSPGKPRPTAFKDATVLEKVTDATSLPPGVQLYDPKQGAKQTQKSGS